MTSFNDLVSDEREVILNKAILRTRLFAEKNFKAVKPDTRDPRVIAYERDFFNNPKAAQFHNTGVALTWAAVQGITDAVFIHEEAHEVEAVRGVVVNVVNFRDNDLVKEYPNSPYICIHQGNQAFRGMDGEKTYLPLNTRTIVPGTDEDCAAIIDAMLDKMPASFIKNLGDALESIELE